MFHLTIMGVFPNCIERCGLPHLNGEKKLQNWQYTSIKWKGPYLRLNLTFVFIRLISKPYGIWIIRKTFQWFVLIVQYFYYIIAILKEKLNTAWKVCIFEVILSAFSRIRNANAGKCGPELLRIRKIFTQCNAFICFEGAQQPHIKKFYNLGSWHGHLLLFRTKRFFLQWAQ